VNFLKFDDETIKRMRLVAAGIPKISGRDFRGMSDEKLDEFIAENSHTIHIVAATAERKRRDDAKAGIDEAARYQSANRQSLLAILIAAISLAIAILEWIFPRAPLETNPPHEVRSPASPAPSTNMPAKDSKR
jgi:hypothetical protein